MTPDEVMRMSRYEAIIFINGLPAIHGELPKYFEFEELVRRSQLPPINEELVVLQCHWYLFCYLLKLEYGLD
jgi:type IV secretory pathway TraG/TraD family ATPase VirD4